MKPEFVGGPFRLSWLLFPLAVLIAIVAVMAICAGLAQKALAQSQAKNGFGLMIDTARAGPVLVEKHGRGVVVVLAVEEYERLKAIEAGQMSERANKGGPNGDVRS